MSGSSVTFRLLRDHMALVPQFERGYHPMRNVPPTAEYADETGQLIYRCWDRHLWFLLVCTHYMKHTRGEIRGITGSTFCAWDDVIDLTLDAAEPLGHLAILAAEIRAAFDELSYRLRNRGTRHRCRPRARFGRQCGVLALLRLPMLVLCVVRRHDKQPAMLFAQTLQLQSGFALQLHD